MRVSLKSHPDSPCPAVRGIEVEITRSGPSALELAYQLSGSLRELLIPGPKAPARVDGLWQHSCFELFLRTGDSEAYWEFNFAPSGQWAAYRLSGYRKGMADAPEPAPPRIDSRETGELLEVRVQLETGLPSNVRWRLGVSAVVQDVAGQRSFWALTHPPGAPDFHSPDCFALELGPPPAA